MKHRANRQERTATWPQALTVSRTASALSIGWDLALPIFGGVLLGHHLDRRSGGGYTLTIGLLVLGLVVGVYNVVYTLQRELQRDQLNLTEFTDVRPQDRTQESEGEKADHL